VRALSEVSITDATGRVQRIDRLVEFECEYWILDYKTDSLPTEDDVMAVAAAAMPYREQLAAYYAAVRALQPIKRVQAAILFSSGQLHLFNFED
jgi:ATP-dependent helicase/nuclease subunit A